MFWTGLISAPSASRAVRASVLLETRRGMQTRNNAITTLFPTHENKLLSHQTFEITEKHTQRAVTSSPVEHSSCCPASQAGKPPSPLPRDGGTQATHLSCFLVFRRRNIQGSDPSLPEPVSALAEGGCFYSCRQSLTSAKSLLLSPVTV